jgi:hypothetical protein
LIDAVTKVQKLFDLHIRRMQMQLPSLDGALDKALVIFICLPDQFDCVYEFTRLVLLSNVVSVSPSVFESLGVPVGECAIYRHDDERTVHFPCTSHTQCDQACEAELHDRRVWFAAPHCEV